MADELMLMMILIMIVIVVVGVLVVGIVFVMHMVDKDQLANLAGAFCFIFFSRRPPSSFDGRSYCFIFLAPLPHILYIIYYILYYIILYIISVLDVMLNIHYYYNFP